MNIAICDDDKFFCQQMEEFVQQLFEEKSMRYQCEIFYSGESMLSHTKRNSMGFQIYLLDIGMTGMDGIRVAEVIRQKDLEAIIIFVTSHEEEMPKAFDVLAFHYLVKPLDKHQVFRILSSAVSHLQKRRAIFHFSVRKQFFTLLLSEIIYFESVARKIRIFTVTGKCYEYYGVWGEVEAQVNSHPFIRLHKSYIVNLLHVFHVDGTSILLRNQLRIPISRKYQVSFQRAFRNFVLSGNN